MTPPRRRAGDQNFEEVKKNLLAATWEFVAESVGKPGMVVVTLLGFLAHDVAHDFMQNNYPQPTPNIVLSKAEVYEISHQVADDATAPIKQELNGLDQRIDDLRSDLHAGMGYQADETPHESRNPPMTPETLDACTGCGLMVAEVWAPPLTVAMGRAEIVTALRQAAFLAQVAHESGNFTCGAENTNYSAEQMVEFFPHEFDAESAGRYVGQPEAIANRAYANKDGNGPEDSGDGFRFRGRGPMQTTGRADYWTFSLWLYDSVELLNDPDRLLDPLVGSMAAAWEWTRSKLNVLADQQKFRAITQIINGGQIGAVNREARYQKALQVLHPRLALWTPDEIA